MRSLELRDDQADMLSEVLESYLSDLRMEISHTDSLDYRRILRARKDFLTDLLARLGMAEAGTTR